jgi:hypothetical protein
VRPAVTDRGGGVGRATGVVGCGHEKRPTEMTIPMRGK